MKNIIKKKKAFGFEMETEKFTMWSSCAHISSDDETSAETEKRNFCT